MKEIPLIFVSFIIGFLGGKVYDKYPKVRSIYDTIHLTTPSRISSLFKTLKSIIQIQYHSYYKEYYDKIYEKYVLYLKKPSIVNSNTYEIEYYLNDRLYKIQMKNSRPSNKELTILNEEGRDITEEFISYIGPMYDFHGRKYTPNDLGYKKIIILDDDLNENIYYENDTIEIL